MSDGDVEKKMKKKMVMMKTKGTMTMKTLL